MEISLIDRSLYFKGLLLLIRKDREIHEKEKILMLRIGAIMGFEKKFCRNAIREIMDNKNISDLPPHFSSPEMARCFIHDGIIISLADKEIHDAEISWLKEVAQINGIENILDDYLKKMTRSTAEDLENNLDVKKLNWG